MYKDKYNGYIDSNKDENSELYPKCQLVNGIYVSPWCKPGGKSLSSVLKWKVIDQPAKLDFITREESIIALNLITSKLDMKIINDKSRSSYTWLGHASCYYQNEGIYFLTDPVFSQRCSPSQWVGPSRHTPPPCSLNELKIDIVLLSHTHYDHLDYDSCQIIGNRSLWIVPLGVKAIMHR